MKRFSFTSALDLNMGYSQIKKGGDAQMICTIVFPLENKNTSVYHGY
jgi:hypothetical protein